MAIQPDNTTTNTEQLANSQKSIMDIIQQQQAIDRMQLIKELLKIYDIDITIAGEQQKVLNLELITEYSNANYVKTLVKNETWRRSAKEHFHLLDLNDEKIVGTMDTQFILKMNAHRRKREQAVVNAVRNEVAGTEVNPQQTRRKRFFGMI